MERVNIAAIILAAGYSSRMGELKPLLPIGEITVLERVTTLFRDSGIRDVRVVVGHRAPEMLPILERLKARPLINIRFHEGMFSSVVTGVGSLEDDVSAFFLTPVDIPLVRRETLELLMAARRTEPAAVLYPSFLGRRGHPPLIDACLRKQIMGWKGDGGLKSCLARYEAVSREVETGDEYILHDMDTPPEYEKLCQAHRDRGVPSIPVCENLLLKRFSLDRPLLNHCRAVARLALSFARRLNSAGCRLDMELVAAASLLHDVARGRRDHAAEGALLIDELGYPGVAKIVAVHMDIRVAEDEPVCPGEVVYLADKMTQRDGYVSIEERFASRLKTLESLPDALDAARLRLENARLIRRRVEEKLGCSLREVMADDGLL